MRRNDVLVPGSVITFGVVVLAFFLNLTDRFVTLENRLVKLEVGQESIKQLLKSVP